MREREKSLWKSFICVLAILHILYFFISIKKNLSLNIKIVIPLSDIDLDDYSGAISYAF